MSVRYLLDTCVWRDFYEGRTGRGGRPLGSFAYNLFVKFIKEKYEVIITEGFVKELSDAYTEEGIYDMIAYLDAGCQVRMICPTKEQYLEARKLSSERDVPFNDCLNAVIARDESAMVVSQDNHYFNQLSDISDAVRPEELI